MASIYYCFDNKLRFSKQVVLSLRLYDKEIIPLMSLGIGSIMYWELKIMYYARIIQFLFPIHDTADTQRHEGNNLYICFYVNTTHLSVLRVATNSLRGSHATPCTKLLWSFSKASFESGNMKYTHKISKYLTLKFTSIN